jgi:hypothetical protein
MKLFVVSFRHEVVGLFKDVAKAAECAESVAQNSKPDPDSLWDRSASIVIKDVDTDLV